MTDTNWKLYEDKLRVHGGTKRDRNIYRTKHTLHTKILNSSACKQVKIDDRPGHLIILSTDSTIKKNIYALPGDFLYLGSIILWNKSHWIVTEVDKDDDVMINGSMEMCNMELSWQNHITGKIHTRWATVQKPYSSNVDNHPVISVSKREYQVQLSYDAESSLIDVDKRFVLQQIGNEPKTYRCTSVDNITERFDHEDGLKGFLVLNLTQDQYNSDVDNKELGICNYVKIKNGCNNSPEVKQNNYKITYKGNPEVKIGGTKKKFSYQITDINNNLIKMPNEQIQWNVAIADNKEKALNISYEGNDIYIEATNDNLLVGVFFVLSLYKGSEQIDSLTVKVVSLFG
ncbi:MAG: hypothetical protein RR370_01835 [Synergistaceae bacterium]